MQQLHAKACKHGWTKTSEHISQQGDRGSDQQALRQAETENEAVCTSVKVQTGLEGFLLLNKKVKNESLAEIQHLFSDAFGHAVQLRQLRNEEVCS